MRLEITQRAGLTLRALVVLHGAASRLKSVDLASTLGTTAGFIPQVMGPLVRAGWVHSVPGPTGGYEMQVDLDDITVLEVVDLVDGPADLGGCVVAGGACDTELPCALHATWDRVRTDLRRSLSDLPISALGVRCSEGGDTPDPATPVSAVGVR